MALWVCRAGKSGDREPYALENNVVVAGWNEVADLREVSERAALLPLLNEVIPDEAENTLKNWETQLWAFAKRIAPGDIVVLPRKRTSTLAFARVTGGYKYEADVPDGCHHQIPVQWLKTDVPRKLIDSDLRFSFGGAMTVFQVSRNNAEDRVRAMLEGKAVASNAGTEEGDGVIPVQLDPESIARDKIFDHIDQKFRGHELERLVEAVLIAQGFVTRRSDKGADGGVDILCGKGLLRLESPRLCVQVKSQDAAVDVKAVRELHGVLSGFGADLGLLVSWGGFTGKADEEARRNFFKMRLWDPDILIDQVVGVYDRLSEDIQNELPLKRIWTLVEN